VEVKFKFYVKTFKVPAIMNSRHISYYNAYCNNVYIIIVHKVTQANNMFQVFFSVAGSSLTKSGSGSLGCEINNLKSRTCVS
jgi:hypothetical protein